MSSPEMPVAGSINEYVESLRTSKRLGHLVVHHAVMESRAPVYADAGFAGSEPMAEILRELGIEALYSHQQAAISAVSAGRNVVVATPTSSGKTLIYNLPVLEQIIREPETRAMYLFPLKALAQDQLRAFNETAGACRGHAPTAAIYDGDTSAWRRKKIRENPPNVIMTNPEMIHLGFLPHHDKWAAFFANLKYVVVDEVHTYRGVLGSHMAQVLRRFLRVCAEYGAAPVFIFSSATIANPAELAETLTGLTVHPITASGAPEGRRHLVFINPADSPPHTAIQLLKAALFRQLRSIVYCQSRKMTELIAMWAGSGKGPFSEKISAYRAGFLPEERREIEGQLLSGELLAVIATSALELGIDIGDLDLCLLVGYPGTVMATRQRGGRVGRAGRDSAVVLIGGEDALDQYILRHAEEFIHRPPESAMVNPDNPEILSRHLVCAAAEHPVNAADAAYNRPMVRSCLDELVAKGELLCSADGQMYYAARKSPHRHVELRGSGSRFTIIDGPSGQHLGEADGFRAFRETHPGAIYLHHGQTYRVDKLDPETRTVTARRANPPYYTRVRANKETEILAVYAEKTVGATRICFGRLKVTDQITGYEKMQIRDKKRINILPLDLPPQIFETEGIWFTIPAAIQAESEAAQMHFMGGIHAVEHAAIGICPLFVLSDRNDLGGISIPFHPQVGSAAVFVYDAFPGGIGLCRSAFDRAEALLEETLHTIAACECESGCPSCVHSPKCGSGNRPIDKLSAAFILKRLTARDAGEVNPSDAAVLTQSGQSKPSTVKSSTPLPDYGVLDIETRRSAEEVGGWHRSHLMGVSCAVLYLAGADDYRVYYDTDISALVADMQRLELIVGFNIKRFDYGVLGGYVDFSPAALPTLDILESVHGHLGYRLSLDHLARESLGEEKTADGLQALKWWKQGRIDDIVAYCKKDVAITNNIYLYGRRNGYLLFRNKAGHLVRLPVNW
ncbi:MAG: DEAD/DEAH box helicase [Thermodesulfobacteriota bacterium]